MATGPVDYDVIIAGGGPAGASAAYFLSRAGKNVLILEKASLPRYKGCGGGVSLEFLRSQFPFDFSPVIDRTASLFEYHFNGIEMPVRCRLHSAGFVQRARFDAFLLQQCGAEVSLEEAVRDVSIRADGVEVETSRGRRIKAAWLIGADGANSIVRRKAGFAPHEVVLHTVEAEVFPSSGIMQRFVNGPLFIFEGKGFGYTWVFPKADHLSVGTVGMQPAPGELRERLARIMKPYGISLDGAQLHAHPLPVYTRHQPVAAGRVLLAGDAAGLVDPFSGEGIRIAIQSGRIGAECILEGGTAAYHRRIQREIGRGRLNSRLAAAAFYRLRFLCLLFGATNPFTTDLVLDLLAEHISTLRLVFFAIASLPAFALVELAGWMVELFGGEKKRQKFLGSIYPGGS
jgi:geranylgeranyl reductase family protein